MLTQTVLSNVSDKFLFCVEKKKKKRKEKKRKEVDYLPGTESVGHTDGSVDVLGVDTGSKTVGSAVTDLDGLVNVLELLDGDDRTEDLLLGDLHVLINVGEQGRLDEVTLVTVALTTDLNLGTALLAAVDVLHDAVELELGDLRALEGVGGEGVTDLVLGGTLPEAGNELVVDALLDQQARTGAAALAVVEEDTKVRPGDGVVNVSVLEDDVGGLATQLKSDLLEVALGSGLEDGTTDHGGTGEGHLVNVHVAGDGGTSNTTETRDDVDHTRGEASLLDQLTHVQTGERGLLGSLHDNGVTGRHGGGNLPGPHEEREVPGDDLTADTNGLVAGVAKGIGVGVNGLAVDLVGPSGVVANAANGVAHVDLGNVESLAVVSSLESSQVVNFPLHQVGQLGQQAAAFGGGHLAPGALESLAGRGDGSVDILLGSLVDGGDGLFGSGVGGLEGLALSTLDVFVVDEPDKLATSPPHHQPYGAEAKQDLQSQGLLNGGSGCLDGGGERHDERGYV